MHETQNNEKGKEQMDSWSSQKKKKRTHRIDTFF